MKPLIIGIAGGTASGKSTFTRKIADHIGPEKLVVINHDSYYRDLSFYGDRPITDINFDHPDALETAMMIDHIKQLKKMQSIEMPVYDFSTHRRLKEVRKVNPTDVIIVDGILIFCEKKLRDLFNIRIFVDTDDDERLLRRLKRDITDRGRSVESVFHQYITFVKPMHLEFVEPSKRWADVIVPRGGENEIALNMILSQIKLLNHT
ncbi:MAG: uridine kinase [Bacteroidetes bacterium]|nr:uridine kinase [Bacteroidota bacterium]